MKLEENSLYQNYLGDLGILLKEMALEAKQQADKRKTDFSEGYLMGFYRTISLMQQQAEAFNIPLEKIGLDNINCDEDLI